MLRFLCSLLAISIVLFPLTLSKHLRPSREHSDYSENEQSRSSLNELPKPLSEDSQKRGQQFDSLIQQDAQFRSRPYREARISPSAADHRRVARNSIPHDIDGYVNDEESHGLPDLSCIGPGQSICGVLTLCTCPLNRSERSTSFNVSRDCVIDEYAKLEKTNLLRCVANMTELRLRFSLNQSIIGMFEIM